jgi:hypothetical protein
MIPNKNKVMTLISSGMWTVLLCFPEDGGSIFLQNLGTLGMPNYMALPPRV